MSRRPWRIGVPSVTEDEVNSLVTRARIDIAEILDDVLDTEAGLTRIYAAHGQQSPSSVAAPTSDKEGGQVEAVCERIALLETTLARAAKPNGPSLRAGLYLHMARGFLFELRSGLASRDLSAEDADRLLNTVRRDLEEADRTLRSEQRLSLPLPTLAGIGEMRELTSEMTDQLTVLDEQVMQLFGHSNDPAAVPVPHH
jgi:hypothetical protein